MAASSEAVDAPSASTVASTGPEDIWAGHGHTSLALRVPKPPKTGSTSVDEENAGKRECFM
eukprot:3465001-Alexandrium_andersonii.AAC.1